MITSADALATVLMTKTGEHGTVARKRLASALNVVVPRSEHQISVLFDLTHASQVFFADRVVLAEGKTEQRLIPQLFRQISGRTLGQAGVALIPQSGVDNTKKTMNVLQAMDIPVSAIVDLDFAFRGAITHGFLSANDPDIAICKGILARLAATGVVRLGADGLPIGNGATTAASAFERLVAEDDSHEPIARIATQLKEKDVWVWTAGAIEAHLGLKAKTEAEWSSFQLSSEEKGPGAIVKDFASLEDLTEWLVR